MFSRFWHLSLVAGATLTGCATTAPLSGLDPHQGQAVIALIEQPMNNERERLRAVLAPTMEQDDPRLTSLLDTQTSSAETLALHALTAAFSTSPLHIASCNAPFASIPKSLDPSFIEHLTQHCKANYVLLFHISDYGLTPQAWRYGYFTFEVASTLGIAAVIIHSGVKSARALAGAYLAQESAEELIEGYAGLWALDEVSRPVRIEASLFQLPNPTPIWHGAATGLCDTHPGRLFRAVSDQEKQDQLHQSIVHAALALKVELDGIEPQASVMAQPSEAVSTP